MRWAVTAETTMMLRIEIARYGAVSVLRLIGHVGSTHVDELRAVIRGPYRTAMLDLDEVSLIDLDAVRFLVACEAEGIELIRCSRYIREWMKREPHQGTRRRCAGAAQNTFRRLTWLRR
jgi:hypothetical protein